MSDNRRHKRSVIAQKIAKRLVDLGEIDPSIYDIEYARIERFYTGPWQRAAGAWSWCLGLDRLDGKMDGGKTFGSQFTASECANAKGWLFYPTGIDYGIIPGDNEASEWA